MRETRPPPQPGPLHVRQLVRACDLAGRRRESDSEIVKFLEPERLPLRDRGATHATQNAKGGEAAGGSAV